MKGPARRRQIWVSAANLLMAEHRVTSTGKGNNRRWTLKAGETAMEWLEPAAPGLGAWLTKRFDRERFAFHLLKAKIREVARQGETSLKGQATRRKASKQPAIEKDIAEALEKSPNNKLSPNQKKKLAKDHAVSDEHIRNIVNKLTGIRQKNNP